jgi:hypothetical protein
MARRDRKRPRFKIGPSGKLEPFVPPRRGLRWLAPEIEERLRNVVLCFLLPLMLVGVLATLVGSPFGWLLERGSPWVAERKRCLVLQSRLDHGDFPLRA